MTFSKVLQLLFISRFDCHTVIAEIQKKKRKTKSVRNKQDKEDWLVKYRQFFSLYMA